MPELGTVPTTAISETLESDAVEEHQRNKNPSELKGEVATDLSAVPYTSPALSIGYPLTVEGEEEEGHGPFDSLIRFNVNNESLHNLIPPSLALHRSQC